MSVHKTACPKCRSTAHTGEIYSRYSVKKDKYVDYITCISCGIEREKIESQQSSDSDHIAGVNKKVGEG